MPRACKLLEKLIFLYLSFLTLSTDGKYIEGTLTSTSNWEFLTRFCFMSQRGSLEFEFEYPESYMTQNLLLYWDAPGLWDSVYKSSLTCQQRTGLLSRTNLQIFPLEIRNSAANCDLENGTMHCRSPKTTFDTVRDRWWYLAIANCDTKIGLRLKYKMWLRNGEPGDTFFEHFSADEFYILQTDIAFLLLQITVLVVAIIFAVMLSKKRHFHTTYRLFIVSASLQLAHLLFACILWGSYANSGVMLNGLRYFVDVIGAASQIIFILMLLLMSVGYTIICGKLPTALVVAIMVFIALLSVCYVALFIYEAYSFDPGWVLYRYESPSGYGLMALVILAWLVFVGSCIFTLVTHTEKRAFYIRFLIFFSIWFWAVPTIVFISIRHIPPYMREKVVNGLNLSVVLLSHLFYLWLTRPTEGNGNFPYHIRTEQIDVITLEEATDKALDEQDQFHDIDGGQRRNTDFSIFTTSGAGTPGVTKESAGKTGGAPRSFDALASSQPRGGRLPPLDLNATDQSGDAQPPSNRNIDLHSKDEEDTRIRIEGQLQRETSYVPRNLDSLFSFGPPNAERPREADL